jgi:hypothetical protein
MVFSEGWLSWQGKSRQESAPTASPVDIAPFNCTKYSLCKKYKNVVVCKCIMRSKRA